MRRIFIIGLFAFGLATCGPNTTLMSEAEEAQIGAREHAKMIKAFGGVYDDTELGAYVAGIGLRVIQASRKPDAPYRLTILDSPVLNAFALPGGYIYVTRGLLALVNSEAELAAVLGHEVAHVTARHGAHRHTQGIGAGIVAGVLAAVLNNEVANQLAELGWRAWLSKYNRTQEYEADKLGVETLYRAGYDAHGAAGFLASMGAYGDLRAQLAGNQGQVPGWLASHPNTDDRVDRAAALADQLQPAQKENLSAAIGRAPYLAAIDGLRYTEASPKQAKQGRKLKIKIVEVQPQDTIASLVARMQVSALPEQHFRILNNYMTDEKLRPGQKVKLIITEK